MDWEFEMNTLIDKAIFTVNGQREIDYTVAFNVVQ